MAHSERKYVTYADKMRRADKEARYALIAFAVIVIAWFTGGFGLAAFDIEVASTPLWIIGGIVGTWLVAIAAAVVLGGFVYADFDLDDTENAESGKR